MSLERTPWADDVIDLVVMASRESPSPAERDPVIDAYRAGIDLTLIRRNLALSVEERFLQLMAMQQYAEELRRAGRAATRR